MLRFNCISCEKPIEVSGVTVTTEYDIDSDVPLGLGLKVDGQAFICGGCQTAQRLHYDFRTERLSLNDIKMEEVYGRKTSI